MLFILYFFLGFVVLMFFCRKEIRRYFNVPDEIKPNSLYDMWFLSGYYKGVRYGSFISIECFEDYFDLYIFSKKKETLFYYEMELEPSFFTGFPLLRHLEGGTLSNKELDIRISLDEKQYHFFQQKMATRKMCIQRL